MDSVIADVRTIVGGAFALQPEAFRAAVLLPGGWYFAAAVILLAGLSDAVGQSVVLFANKVQPSRFVFSLLVNALLIAAGYLFLVASTWAIMQLPGQPHVAFGDLAVVLALAYLPYWFAFLVALPYLGYGINWLLRTLHLVALVVAVASIAGNGVFGALACVGLGWLVVAIAQQTFGKPVALLGERLLNAVAGVEVTANEQLAVDRLDPADLRPVVDGAATPAASTALRAPRAPAHSSRWKVALALAAMLALGYVCALALAPMHRALFGWQAQLPQAVQLPLDLLWIALIGILVAGFMAPLETLGWWAGWYGDRLDTSAAPANASGPGDGTDVARYVVYLDGISQSGARYLPDIEVFLDALAPRLPQGTRLVRGVMTYSVINRPLDEDPIFSWFWTWVDKARSANAQSLLGMFVNLRNVLIVAVSADTRYGPIYNYGIAQLVYDALIASGYRRRSGTPVTFIGYSGGGQMAAASAAKVSRALEAPVDVISLGGVISGNARVLEVEHLYHFIGDRDGVQRLGPIMFPSRWKVAVLSNWNRALRLGRLSIFSLGPVAHQVPGGMLDPKLMLPDGQSALDQTLDRIVQVLTGRLETAPVAPSTTENNYERYVQAAWNLPAAYPIGVSVDPLRYKPQGEWIGRLILPAREERASVRGAWFEVQLAPPAFAHLTGQRVKLRWTANALLADLVRAVTRDVFFSARAAYTSRSKGLVQPVRVNHWQLVDPLESLAGARPLDDMVVALRGAVAVRDDADPALEITRQPVQISGRYRGLVRFEAFAGGEAWEVSHFNAGSRTFDGPRETVLLPEPVSDSGGRLPSTTHGLATSELNVDGWYVYGSPGAEGRFVVQSMLPRRMLAVAPQRSAPLAGAFRYIHKDAWKEIRKRRGAVESVQFGESEWKAGDRALVTHVYGGIGGTGGEAEAKGPVYFGHFAFGFAEVVDDELSGEPMFDLVFEQVYTHNGDGLIAGAHHASRYLGDRQFGWAGLRPTCNVLLKLDAFDGEFELADARQAAALDGLFVQLEAMTARYRIGDGTGATYVGIANNCAQDSNRALFAALEAIRSFAASQGFAQWLSRHPVETQRFAALSQLDTALSRQLAPFGTVRSDWSENEFTLGTTMTDDPFEQLKIGLGSWRVLLPRLANDTVVKTFLAKGATARVIWSSQIGERDDIAPVVPLTI